MPISPTSGASFSLARGWPWSATLCRMPRHGASIKDQRERLHVGLSAVYDWYERNADLAACVLRDAEYHSLTREIIHLRFGPPMVAYHDVLGAKLSTKQRAVLHLALSYFTWRTLVRESGLKQSAAVGAMVQAICQTYLMLRRDVCFTIAAIASSGEMPMTSRRQLLFGRRRQ